MASTAAAGSGAAESKPLGVIDPAAFSGGFSVSVLLASLAKDALKQQKYAASRSQALEGGTAPGAAKASLAAVQQVLSTLDRAEVELQQLHKEVSKKVTQLQVTFNQQETKYKAEVAAIETNTGAVRNSFRELEARMNRVSQIGTRIGDRLQTADSLRTRALQLVEVMSYLRQFSELDEGSADFKRMLPPVFWEDGGLHEAAVLTRKLTALVVDAMSAKQRSKLLQVADDALEGASVKGSLEYTYARLQQYSAWLETRMVARFDKALAKDNLATMAECTKVMTEFGRGKTIMQRYVSTHPMLMLTEDEVLDGFPGRPKGRSPAELQLSLKPLDELYRELLGFVKEEAVRMAYIFPDPKPAMELLVQRMFEERVKPVVERLLGREDGSTPASSSTPRSSSDEDAAGDGASNAGRRRHRGSGHLHTQLVVTTEVYHRTRAFMEAVQAAAAPPLGPLDLGLARDSLFGSFLASYPQPELTWLMSRYEEEAEARRVPLPVAAPPGAPPAAPKKASASGTPTPPPQAVVMVMEVSVQLVDVLIACHDEALRRVDVLATGEAQLAACVKALFHGLGPFAPMQGSLLQQLAHHVLDGVEQTLDLCNIRNARAEAKQEVEATLAARALLRQQLMVARYEAYMEHEQLPQAPRLQEIERATATAIGQVFVRDRIHKVLHAAAVSSTVMAHVQQFYGDEVAPRLSSSIADLSACSAGLIALLRAAEEGVLLVLKKAADAVVIQVEKLLMLEQRHAEFIMRAEDVEGGSFTRPTNACRLVCSLLTALHKEAAHELDGANLASFLTEIGSRVHAVFLNHIQQFVFSPHGALRLKADINEYTECVKATDLPQLLDKFNRTQVLANVLVVAPDSLLPLVNGTLRLDHREALKYVRLREDFATAVVDGKSLQQLFGEGSQDAGGVPGRREASVVAR